MNLLGIHLGLWLGPTVPVPAPIPVLEALEKVEVTHKAEGCSGFQLVFHIGRGGPADLLDHQILSLIKANIRVILTVTFNAIPRVLSDGIVTHIQFLAGNGPGQARLCVTGEDVSCAMTMEEKEAEHPAQPELVIVNKIVLQYAQYGMAPMVVPPPLLDPPLPVERTPVQRCHDRDYVKELGKRFDYVFHIIPGPVPGLNTAYWGPRLLFGIPQPALTVNMGPATNVKNLQFNDDSQKPVTVSGRVQDRSTNKAFPVQSLFSTRLPTAVLRPTPLNTRTVLPMPTSGLTAAQALARATGMMDASFDGKVAVTGELDTLRYNSMLQPRRLVGLRGAGYRFDGLYFVKKVTHCIERGNYQQSFELSRDGLGSLLPVLPV